MKILYYSMLLLMVLTSCKKGKTLPREVAVQLVMASSASVYPEDHFPPFDPTDLFETLQYPRYAHDLSKEQIVKQFRDDLSSYLGDNHIKLQEDSAEYKLVVGTPELSESMNRQSYDDLCSPTNGHSYVYYSSLTFKATASLYKKGILIDSWKKEGNSWERLKTAVNSCNAPKVGIILRRSASLISQVAKELRVLISKKMSELEG